jgi:hypothetical protein
MSSELDIRAYNREAWNLKVERENPWTRPVTSELIEQAFAGNWSVLLTECKPVPRNWFPTDLSIDILCLASGGGQQGPILAAAGASDIEAAGRFNDRYDKRIIRHDRERNGGSRFSASRASACSGAGTILKFGRTPESCPRRRRHGHDRRDLVETAHDDGRTLRTGGPGPALARPALRTMA